MNFRQKLGKFIKERYGDNYAGLENLSGVSAIRKIVNGSWKNPTLGTLKKIVEVLHVKLHELFDASTVIIFVRERRGEYYVPEDECIELFDTEDYAKYTINQLIKGD